MNTVELIRSIFDKKGIGVILIGMPGMEKRLSRFPQFYSRVGFAHHYRSLTGDELTFVLTRHWRSLGINLDNADLPTHRRLQQSRVSPAAISAFCTVCHLAIKVTELQQLAKDSCVSRIFFCYNLRMTIFGYARVSTDGQTLDSQDEALKAAGCEKIFREKISGARGDRPQLLRLMAAIGSGDVLMVTRLDRLARSTRDLLNIVDSLAQRGTGFRSLGDRWADTTTPHGRLMLTVLAGLAEFERELIRVRTREGRERAKARGQHMGRPPALTAYQQQEAIRALRAGTASQADLARQFNVNQSTISRLADKAATPAPELPKPKIDPDTERAARAFLKRLEGKYPVIESILYGSRARGDHKPDSDADLAVILPGEHGDRYKVVGEFAGIEFDVMLETGILVQAVPFWEGELRHPERFNNPALIENIKREGLRL